MRFTKIKANDEGVQLEYETKKEGSTESVKYDSSDAPLETFVAALQSFKPWALTLIGCQSWTEARVTGVSLSETKDNRRGLIVTIVRPIPEASGRVVVVNTPLMNQAGENTSGDATGIFGPDILKMIAAAEVEATNYRKGKRAQIDAFQEAENDKPVTTGDGTDETKTDDLTKRRRKRQEPAIVKTGDGALPVANPNAEPPTVDMSNDEGLRKLLLRAGRDVPVEAIAKWGAMDFAKARTWAEKASTTQTTEEAPDCVQKDGTLALFDDHAAATEKKVEGDGWTQETPPPKAADVSSVGQ